MNWYVLSDLAILRELGSNLRQVRLNRNQSQQAVADAAGIDRATLSQIEHGRPTSGVVKQIGQNLRLGSQTA